MGSELEGLKVKHLHVGGPPPSSKEEGPQGLVGCIQVRIVMRTRYGVTVDLENSIQVHVGVGVGLGDPERSETNQTFLWWKRESSLENQGSSGICVRSRTVRDPCGGWMGDI